VALQLLLQLLHEALKLQIRLHLGYREVKFRKISAVAGGMRRVLLMACMAANRTCEKAMQCGQLKQAQY
jgi:hypothetical protein